METNEIKNPLVAARRGLNRNYAARFARDAGVSPSTIHKAETGVYPEIPKAYIIALLFHGFPSEKVEPLKAEYTKWLAARNG